MATSCHGDGPSGPACTIAEATSWPGLAGLGRLGVERRTDRGSTRQLTGSLQLTGGRARHGNGW
jgi:hypothetical protein